MTATVTDLADRRPPDDPDIRTVYCVNPEPDYDHFGVCPECGRTDGYINVGRVHWFLCRPCRTTWPVGENLFSDWRLQTEDEQRAIYDRIGMDVFRTVDPVHDTATIRRLRAGVTR